MRQRATPQVRRSEVTPVLFQKRIERDHAVSIAHERVRGLGSVFRYGRQRHRGATVKRCVNRFQAAVLSD